MGATSGIGREVALQLAQRGWQVGIAGRRTELLAEVAASQGNIIATQQIDVTQEEAPTLLHTLIDEMGGIDLYFHSSGIGWQNEELDSDKELRVVATNGMGFTRMVDAAFNYFAERDTDGKSSGQSKRHTDNHGHIACITSIARTKGLGAAPAYSATKRFQSHYLECLAQLSHIRHLPITFTEVRPGFVATDLIAGSPYPLQMTAKEVARHIVKAVEKKKSIVTIDWRYRLLVGVWRLVPRWLWIRLRITT